MYDDYDDRGEFYEPGGNSSLRAGKRTETCPSCGTPNSLTKKDRQLGYQCDPCADAQERGVDRG